MKYEISNKTISLRERWGIDSDGEDDDNLQDTSSSSDVQAPNMNFMESDEFPPLSHSDVHSDVESQNSDDRDLYCSASEGLTLNSEELEAIARVSSVEKPDIHIQDMSDSAFIARRSPDAEIKTESDAQSTVVDPDEAHSVGYAEDVHNYFYFVFL